MLVKGKQTQSITFVSGDNGVDYISIIDQRHLPFEVKYIHIHSMRGATEAIQKMQVRGAPLIGLIGGYALYFAFKELAEDNIDQQLDKFAETIIKSRPTAVNLQYVVTKLMRAITDEASIPDKQHRALEELVKLTEEELLISRKIGEYGLGLIRELSLKQKRRINILTHCNAGWLATVDYGTALAPIYLAREAGIDVHVWVDETRPRNQGARLTVWELTENGIPNTLITDNAGGLLMQQGEVDMVIVGSDRTTINGDVANKIGTYLKALAAYDNGIPFYVALPSTTIDWKLEKGEDVPIEERNGEEITLVDGAIDGEIKSVLITLPNAKVVNHGFDITPARYVTGLITERGICKANKAGIRSLFPEKQTGGE